MRARLMMKLVSLAVLLVLTIVTAHSFSGGPSSSSPVNPANLVRNGLDGLCANQEATQAAAGMTSSGATLPLPSNDSPLARITGVNGTTFTCPTSTTAAPGG